MAQFLGKNMAPNKKMLVKAISAWEESNRPGFHSDALQVDDGSNKVVARTEELVKPLFAAEQQEKEYTRNNDIFRTWKTLRWLMTWNTF